MKLIIVLSLVVLPGTALAYCSKPNPVLEDVQMKLDYLECMVRQIEDLQSRIDEMNARLDAVQGNLDVQASEFRDYKGITESTWSELHVLEKKLLSPEDRIMLGSKP